MFAQWLLLPTKPKAFAVALLWLMVLLVAGTLAQAKVGLFQSYQTYFAAWVVWLGWLPLPGTLLTLAFVAYGLAAKLLREPFKPAHLGSWLSHAGVLLLLAGGLVMFATSREGYITLRANQSTGHMSDYYAAELALQPVSGTTPVAVLPLHHITAGEHRLGPLTLNMQTVYANTRLLRRADSDDVTKARGMYRIFTLEKAPLEREAELNTAGVVFTLMAGAEDDVGATFGLIENAPVPQPVSVNGQAYHLLLQPAHTALPFTVTLNTFTRSLHPGTAMARSYRSDVTITDGSHVFPAAIEMNRPLRYKGYTLYQASFEQDDNGDTSVLAVVHNKGRLLPYVAGGILAAGLLVQFARRLKVNPKTLAMLALALLPHLAQAAPANVNLLGRLPVQHEGRIKPLDSLARATLAEVAEQEHVAGMSATAWLAEAMFAPAQAQQRPVLRIRNPDAVALLGLSSRQPALYSLAEVVAAFQAKAAQLEPVLNRPDADLTPAERDLKHAYARAQLLFDATRTFSLLEPRFAVTDPTLAGQLDVPVNAPLSYRQLLQLQPRLLPLLERLQQTRRPPNATEAEALRLAAAMRAMEADRASQLVRLLPPHLAGDEVWRSPWQDPLANWQDWHHVAAAYRASDAMAFAHGLHKVSVAEHSSVRPWALDIEYAMNSWRVWHMVTAAYLLAALAAAAAGMGLRHARYAGMAALLAGVALHGAGVVARMVVLERPPVATLYESILVVALTVTAAAALLETRRRDALLLGLGATLGTLLMLLANSYAQGGDSMGMVQAVLNTRFWLATHVLTITLGYGTCLLAGALAHLYLYRRWRGATGTDSLATLMNQTMMLGLALTAVGTFLGGVWADQSWGRFWGWDPKENGALLIVLWLTFVLHARIARWPALLVGARGTALGLMVNNVVVALAWFGVNLLSVGLHSYGFTQGIAAGLGTFCVAQLAAAGGAAWLTRN